MSDLPRETLWLVFIQPTTFLKNLYIVPNMSDFTRDDAERSNGSGPSPFLEWNTGAMSPTYDIVRDVPQDETSWNLQSVSDIHIPPDSPLLAHPEDEQAQHGTVAIV